MDEEDNDPSFYMSLLSMDHYLSKPLPSQALPYLAPDPCYSKAPLVPVVRFYGSTPAGQKAVVHTYPYFFIRSEEDPVFNDPEQLCAFLPTLAKAIDIAMDLKYQTDSTQEKKPKAPDHSKRRQTHYIAKLQVTRGINFYGHHQPDQLFIKLSFYDPYKAKTIGHLLENGFVLQKTFQCYELHVPYLLQVMADTRLEGMSILHAKQIRFRPPLPQKQLYLDNHINTESNEFTKIWTFGTTPVQLISGGRFYRSQVKSNPQVRRLQDLERFCSIESSKVSVPMSSWYARQSCCSLEIDITPHCIQNWQEDKQANARSSLNETPSNQIALVPSLAALWKEKSDYHKQDKTGHTYENIAREDDTRAITPSSSSTMASSLSGSDADDVYHKGLITFPYVIAMREAMQEVLASIRSSVEEGTEKSSPFENAKIPLCHNVSAPFGPIVQHESEAQASSQHSIESNTSEWSFTQYENDRSPDLVPSEMPTGVSVSQQDNEMMEILMDMEAAAENEWKDTITSFFKESEEKESNSMDFPPPLKQRLEDEENEITLSLSEEECQDILVSQMQLHGQQEDSAEMTSSQPEETNSIDPTLPVMPIEEVGSPRLKKRRKMDSDSHSKAKLKRIHDTQQNFQKNLQDSIEALNEGDDEEEEDSDEMEDLIPPAPPLRKISLAYPSNSTLAKTRKFYMLQRKPPSAACVSARASTTPYYQKLFYSNPKDDPTYKRNASKSKEWKKGGNLVYRYRTRAVVPPSAKVFRERNTAANKSRRMHHQKFISPPTPTQTTPILSNERGFHMKTPTPQESPSSSMQVRRVTSAVQAISNLTLLAFEVHVNTRSSFYPDPQLDAIQVICYTIQAREGYCDQDTETRGVILSREASDALESCVGFGLEADGVEIHLVEDEGQLFEAFIDLVQIHNPDFFVGYEVQKASLGYVVERALFLQLDLISRISRIPQVFSSTASYERSRELNDRQQTHGSGIEIPGRIVLNLWRILRHETKLNRYTIEDVAWHVLNRRLGQFSHRQLTSWYKQPHYAFKARVLRYYLERIDITLRLLSHFDYVSRTCASAQLYGMDFTSVMTRGSQYRVECVMLRVTKQFNYVMPSLTKLQVQQQAPLECIPLVMEPESAFYTDPIVVLDFQSLYPSLMIAYNICYSTYLGKFNSLTKTLLRNMGPFDITIPGSSSSCLSPSDTQKMIICPNGTMFTSKKERRGILSQMVNEILQTRIMVKDRLKQEKAKPERNRVYERILDARQYALKMIANVTYGYTAASFSGRMPCSQIADAIVQSGRCTLENAILMTEANTDWNARVVYGDTDSLFVHLPGRTKEQAFEIGNAIARQVTESNPAPMQLKFEKVYIGAALLSKKRYVGFKYDSPTDATGSFDAKGIETIRRDTCPVVAKMMEKVLRIMFVEKDLSRVKAYILRQWTKILRNQVLVQDFIFAKEVRLGTYRAVTPTALPPAAMISVKAMTKDRRAEPRYAERIAYVVVNGPPSARLIDLVVSPEVFLERENGYTINAHYYITKQIIPALERVLLLAKVDIRAWYRELPRPSSFTSHTKKHGPVACAGLRVSASVHGNRTIDSFYSTRNCALCDTVDQDAFCSSCKAAPQQTLFALQKRQHTFEERIRQMRQTCQRCTSINESNIPCRNYACSYSFEKGQVEQQLQEIEDLIAKQTLE